MINIDIRHLKLVKTVNETQNLTKAANKLFVTQPALSQQLKELEDRLHVKLFQRSKKKMIITKYGKRVLITAEKVLKEIKETENDIKKSLEGVLGELKIGSNCIFSFQWLPSAIKSFQDYYPNIELTMGHSHKFLQDLRNDRFDLVITSVPFSHRQFKSDVLFEDDVVLAVSPIHPLRTKKYIIEKDFEDVTLISNTEKEKDIVYQSVLLPSDIKLKKFMTINHPDAFIEAIKSDLGVGVIPKWAIRQVLFKKEIIGIPLTENGVRLHWRVIYLKKKLNNYQKFFLEVLHETLNDRLSL